jgi:iron complex outermembrane receptor protein
MSDELSRLASPIGRLGLDLSGSYVAQWKQQLDGVNYTAAVGRAVVGAIPRWRHYLSLKWDYGPWSATLAQTLSSGYIDENLNAAGKNAESYQRRLDVQGKYNGFKNATICAGHQKSFRSHAALQQSKHLRPGDERSPIRDPRGGCSMRNCRLRSNRQ